jgi:hypothetical protein
MHGCRPTCRTRPTSPSLDSWPPAYGWVMLVITRLKLSALAFGARPVAMANANYYRLLTVPSTDRPMEKHRYI